MLPKAKKPLILKPSNSISTISLLLKLLTFIQKIPLRSPKMQKALNKGNYKLNAIIDKLLAQIKLPRNLTLKEYYMLLNRPRLIIS